MVRNPHNDGRIFSVRKHGGIPDQKTHSSGSKTYSTNNRNNTESSLSPRAKTDKNSSNRIQKKEKQSQKSLKAEHQKEKNKKSKKIRTFFQKPLDKIKKIVYNNIVSKTEQQCRELTYGLERWLSWSKAHDWKSCFG